MDRTIHPRSAVVLGASLVSIFLAGLLAGCPPQGPDTTGPAGLSFEFPDSGDVLAIVTGEDGGRMAVYGSRDDMSVRRIEFDDPDGSFAAEFDEQGRPTRAALNEDIVFEFTHHEDGTFDYTQTEGGASVGQGAGLSPFDGPLNDSGSALKSDGRSQLPFTGDNLYFTIERIVPGTRQYSSLEQLQCADAMISATASLWCDVAGFPNMPRDSLLVEELTQSRRLLNGYMMLCAVINAEIRAQKDAEECEKDARTPDLEVDEADCDILWSTKEHLHLLARIVISVVLDESELLLSGLRLDAEEFCAAPSDPPPPDDPPPPPPSGDVVTLSGEIRMPTSDSHPQTGLETAPVAGAAVRLYDFSSGIVIGAATSSDEPVNFFGHNWSMQVPAPLPEYVYLIASKPGFGDAGCCVPAGTGCNHLLLVPVNPSCTSNTAEFRLRRGGAWPAWGAGDWNLDGLLPEPCDGVEPVFSSRAPSAALICVTGSPTAPTFGIRSDVPNFPSSVYITGVFVADWGPSPDLGPGPIGDIQYGVTNPDGIQPPFQYGDTSIAADPKEEHVIADGSTPLRPGRLYRVSIHWSDDFFRSWDLQFELRP